MATINATWHWFDLKIKDTWTRNILPHLSNTGISTKDLRHAVYIIKIAGLFAVEYENGGISPVIYIGEGNFKQRISNHQEWLGNITELVNDTMFKVGVCIPKKGNGHYANKDFEAVLLHKFRDIFGSAPMKNRQMEYAAVEHTVSSYANSVIAPLRVGRGIRYYWAIKPLKANVHYDDYHKA